MHLNVRNVVTSEEGYGVWRGICVVKVLFSLLHPFPVSDENTLALPVPGESDGESDSSDRIPVPSFQNSFSQAIEAALLKLDKPSTADHLSGKRQGEGRKAF